MFCKYLKVWEVILCNAAVLKIKKKKASVNTSYTFSSFLCSIFTLMTLSFPSQFDWKCQSYFSPPPLMFLTSHPLPKPGNFTSSKISWLGHLLSLPISNPFVHSLVGFHQATELARHCVCVCVCVCGVFLASRLSDHSTCSYVSFPKSYLCLCHFLLSNLHWLLVNYKNRFKHAIQDSLQCFKTQPLSYCQSDTEFQPY